MRVAFVFLLWCVSRLALAAPAVTAADLDAFFDGYVPGALARGDVAGAALVVVKDGQVLFEKGYGLSDIANRKPVDPKNTLFRAGSAGMVATWVAVMQLVDQGKLDLDRDINDYLDFRIPPTWPKPISLRDLMTQQSGFEEIARDVVTDRQERMSALDAGARTYLPDRIFPAGQIPASSDYGVALAGLIVERVSGQPFERYAADHLFQPLGMTRSSFAQPLPPTLAGSLALGYRRTSAPAETFDYYWMSPARGLSATAGDMGRLMMALLSSGTLDGVQILSPSSTTTLLGEDRRRDPNIGGMGLGLAHLDRNGHAVMGLAGETSSFRATFDLVPDAGLGFYFVQNGTGNRAGDIRAPLFQAFMDRYFPAAASAEPTQASATADGALVAGAYRLSRRAESSFLRLADLHQMIVSQNPDGTISVDSFTDPSRHPRIWREIKPYLWRDVGGPSLLAVRLENGHPAEIVTDALPPSLVLTPAPPLRSASWSAPLLGVTLALLAAMVVLMPLRGILRLAYRARSGEQSALFGVLVWLVALIDLLFLGGFVGFLWEGSIRPTFLSADQDWIIETLHVLGIAALAGTLVPIIALRAGLGDRRRSWFGRIGALLPVLTSLSVTWFAVIYHLVGWSTAY